MDPRSPTATGAARTAVGTSPRREAADARLGAALALAVVTVGAVAGGAALLVQRGRWRTLVDELAGLGYEADELGGFEPSLGLLASAGLEGALAVLAGALLGLAVPRTVRAAALGAGAVLGWSGLAWFVTTSAARLTVPWPGGLLVDGSAVDVVGPAVLLVAVGTGLAVARGRGSAPLRSACSRLATLVVLGIVLVGTALTAALLTWSALLGWGDGAVALTGGALPWLPALVALTWWAAGRHRLVPVIAVTGAAVLQAVMTCAPFGSVGLAYGSGEWLALATVIAAGLTAVGTAWLAAYRRSACEALGSVVE